MFGFPRRRTTAPSQLDLLLRSKLARVPREPAGRAIIGTHCQRVHERSSRPWFREKGMGVFRADDAIANLGAVSLGVAGMAAGRKDMLNFIRALPMTAQELVEEYFESEIVKAAIASVAIHGSTLGPMSAGTGYTLIHNWLNRGGLSHVNVGKAGEITSALANAVKSFRGEIRTEAEVKSIQVDKYTCRQGACLRVYLFSYLLIFPALQIICQRRIEQCQADHHIDDCLQSKISELGITKTGE